MSNNIFSDMNNSDILFINILNTMYNDNWRTILNLIDQNNEIRASIMNIFNRRDRERNTLSSEQNSNINPSTPINNDNNSNPNNNRIYINNIPYIIEGLQYLPLSSNNNQNSDITRFDGNNDDLQRLMDLFLQPIDVFPTQSEIQRATRNTVYSDILNPTNTSCPISLENFTDSSQVTMIIPCRHIFNTDPLMSWFTRNTRCPVCRYDIRNYNVNGNDTTNTSTNEHTNEENSSQSRNRERNPNPRRQFYTFSVTPNNMNEQTIASFENLFFENFSDISNTNFTTNNFQPLFNSFFSNRRN